jgi:hypothetical protein
VLQFVLVAVVMTGVAWAAGAPRPGPAGVPARRRLRLDRAALLLLAEALPRRRERHQLIATSEEEFLRLTRARWTTSATWAGCCAAR